MSGLANGKGLGLSGTRGGTDRKRKRAYFRRGLPTIGSCKTCDAAFKRDWGSNKQYCCERCQKRAEKWRALARKIGEDPEDFQRKEMIRYKHYLAAMGEERDWAARPKVGECSCLRYCGALECKRAHGFRPLRAQKSDVEGAAA